MQKPNDECINPEKSLVELYHERDTIKAKIKMATLTGNTKNKLSLNKEYREISARIKAIEDVGYNGGGVIRLM